MTETEQIAYHEAAHAVIHWHVRMPFTEVSIIPGDHNLGHVSVGVVLKDVREDSVSTTARLWVERRIMCLQAGPAMDEILGLATEEESSDLHAIVDLAARVCGPGTEAGAFCGWLWERTKNTLGTPVCRIALQALAQVLLKKGRVSARTARKVMRESVQDAARTGTWKAQLEAMPGTWPE